MTDPEPELISALRRRLSETPTDMGSATPSAAPASRSQLSLAERKLGFSLPASVRHVYENVANGGFGPGYGLVGFGGGVTGFANGTRRWYCEDEYASQVGQQGVLWPIGLVPICDWGCGIFSCIDCSTVVADVRRAYLDAMLDGLPEPIQPEGYTFLAWLQAWIDGVDVWSAVSPA